MAIKVLRRKVKSVADGSFVIEFTSDPKAVKKFQKRANQAWAYKRNLKVKTSNLQQVSLTALSKSDPGLNQSII
jgi:hypothetical protein